MVGYLTNTPSQWKLLKFLLLLISAIGIFLTSNPISKKRFTNSLFFSTFLMVYILLYALLQSYDRISTIVFSISFFIIAFVVSCFYERENPQILFKYRNLIVIIAIISLFFWMFGSILAVFSPSGIVYTSWNGTDGSSFLSIKNYYYMYFETQTTNFAGLTTYIIRNSAIFTEGPMASLNFCLAIAINQLLDKTENKRKKLFKYILCGAVVTTFSVTGYIFLIILSAFGYMKAHKNSLLSEVIKYCLFVIILFVASLFIVRLVNQKLSVDSGQLRVDDYIASFKAWKMHPFIGSGLGNDNLIYSYMGSWRMKYKLFGLSNSISPIFAEGGLYIAVLYISIFVGGIVRNIKNKRIDSLFFLLLVVFLLFSTIFPYQYVLIMILICAIK